MPRALRIALWGLLLVVPATLVLLRLPYYAVGPGPAREIAPLIRFDGLQRFDSGGRFVMTTVRWYQLTPLSAVRVWLDDAWRSVPREELFPAGLDREEEEAISRAQMDQSQIDAASVVLQELAGYPDEHGPGALVEVSFPPCPAYGVLFPGEIITAIDGQGVDSLEEADRLLGAADAGEELTFDVASGDARREVELAPERCVEDEDDAFFGVRLVENFPIDVDMEGADVGGPSGGLMFAVGLYDLLTPGDLTGGTTVAGTGTLDLEGAVGPIGGIRDKVLGAEAVGASLFLVPRENLEELRGMDTGEMRVVPVASFDEAREALLEAGGEDDATTAPLQA
jgi:PDZ domain-containing protein